MNNAARGVILAIALLGMGLMFFAMLNSFDYDTQRPFDLEDLATVLMCGLAMLSCAVIGGGALAGMRTSPKTFGIPPMQPGIPPQMQGYPQPGALPQPYLPQQHAAQPYGQRPPEAPAG